MDMQSPSQYVRHRNRQPLIALLAGLGLGLGTALSALAAPTMLTVDPATVTAGPLPGTLNFNVTRTGDLGYDADLSFRTADGTAIAGTDYTAAATSVLFPEGATTGVLTVPVAADPGGNTVDRTLQLIVDSAIGLGSTPSFGATGRLFVNAFSRPLSIAQGDFNGDGRPDLVVGNATGASVTFLFNTTAPGATSASYAVGATVGAAFSSAVGVGDFNGDGKPDVAVATTFGSNLVQILTNTTPPGAASGGFTQSFYLVSGTLRSLAVGDFNGDGRTDVAALTEDGSVSMLRNITPPGASAASFAIPAKITTGGSASIAIVAADFNGDGRLDLATANFSSNNVSILFNTTVPGAATFSFGPTVAVAAGTGPAAIAAGDVNGDGRQDLAVGNASGGTVSVLFNDTAPGAGSASFTLAASPPVAGSLQAVSVADVNGDGKPDLVVGNTGGTSLTVLANRTVPGASSARFVPAATLAVGTSPSSFAVGDANGDGLPDLAVANQGSNDVSVLLNTTPPNTAAVAFRPKVDVQATGIFSSGTEVVVDLNGDGRPDVATAGGIGNNVAVLFDTTVAGAASPSFTAAGIFGVGTIPTTIDTADFNGDGKPDLEVVNAGSNQVSILFNTTLPGAASASFTVASFTVTGLTDEFGTTAIRSGAVGDFNGDGKPDVVLSTFAKRLIFLVSGIAPGASTADFTQTDLPYDRDPSSVALGDLNGDGKPDLISVERSDDQISVLLNTTTGAATPSFALSGRFGTGVGSGPAGLALADFNGDGKRDIAVACTDINSVAILLNGTAPGAATAAFTLAATRAAGSAPAGISGGDFDGDGRTDLAVAAYGGNNVAILLNRTPPSTDTSSAFFIMPISVATDTGPNAVSIGDFNGDGLPDLVTTQGDTGTLSFLLNTRLQASAAGSPATGTIQYLQPDTTPDTFSFAPVTDAEISTVYTSNPVTVTGLGSGVTVPISVTGGSYSIGCTASFVTAPGTIGDGQSVCVRLTSPNAFEATATATLSIGDVSADYVVTTEVFDAQPDAFSFTPVTNAAPNSVQLSNPVTITGVTSGVWVGVSGDESALYCRNSEPCTASGGIFVKGDTFRVQVTSSANPSTTVVGTLMIGNGSASFSVTTAAAPDLTPDAFSFTDVSNVAPGSLQTSSTIIVSGINVATSVSVTGGFYSLNGGPCTLTSGTAVNTDSIQVCHTASASFSTATNTTLTLGAEPPLTGVSDTFTSTTQADQTIDTTPDPFGFASEALISVNTRRTSKTIVITGYAAPTTISVSAGSQYAIGCKTNAFTDRPSMISPGQSVCVRHMSSPNLGTTVTTTLTVGGIDGTYSTTTNLPDSRPNNFSFASVSGAAVNSVNTSNPITVGGINTASPISVSAGSLYSLNNGPFVSTPGTVVNGNTVRIQTTASNQRITAVVATLTIGGINGLYRVTTAR